MSSKVPFELLTIDEEGQPIITRKARSFDANFSADAQTSKISPDSDADPTQKITSHGLEIMSTVVGNVLSHPYVVLRRQCQVNKKALQYHLSPFKLLPVLYQLQRRQGMICLWKGCSGIFILRGCAAVLETIVSELTPFPRDVSVNSSLKQLSQHLLLKLIAFGVLTPFYCASLIETVQSGVASETPGAFDVMKEGLNRLVRRSPRLVPIWWLVVPTATFRVALYALTHLTSTSIGWIKKKLSTKENKHSIMKFLDDLSSLQFGTFVASILVYPAETVLHRLYLQGTRTILDNLDSGTTVVATLTTYEGVSDCYRTILREEGAAGLYKGVGALMLEFALQAGAVAALKFILSPHLQ